VILQKQAIPVFGGTTRIKESKFKSFLYSHSSVRSKSRESPKKISPFVCETRGRWFVFSHRAIIENFIAEMERLSAPDNLASPQTDQILKRIT